MPIRCKGLVASVHSSGKELTPVGIVKSADDKEVTCWIASAAGKRNPGGSGLFSGLGPGFLSGRVEVDGEQCGGIIMEPSTQRDYTFVKAGLETSQDTIRKFTFANVELTAHTDTLHALYSLDDDTFLETSQNIGEICLAIWKVEIVATTNEYRSSHEEGKVHERSKKLTTHRVKLGEEVDSMPTKSSVVSVIGDEPVVKITFKYRPRELLVAEGIIGSTESNAVKTESRKARKARKRRRAAELPAKEESVDDTTGFTNTETVRAGKRRKVEDAPTASGSGYESNVGEPSYSE
ncbi:hypothetical protein FIBSPDRAFT_940807 [Athelia psychrophila]|uniref:DUF7918 domain-containing protein n=1 Tax=Athelia psychrophila TaxID=1759441 RepID=A0A167VAQ2_9AGAM|nr:hypothetical protein FIBSPDRAFT_940807 [Fibularhizoctonia sp. CBS 109695]